MGLSDDHCGFSGPLQRARQDKTQLLTCKRLGYGVRLTVAFFGQRNVGHSLATALTVPKGLPVANEIDCQPSIRCHVTAFGLVHASTGSARTDSGPVEAITLRLYPFTLSLSKGERQPGISRSPSPPS